jgi:hypothetical protein
MNATNEQEQALTHESIANLARQLWQSEGGQEGRDLEYWLKAERQIQAASQTATAKPKTPAKNGGATRTTLPAKGRTAVRA